MTWRLLFPAMMLAVLAGNTYAADDGQAANADRDAASDDWEVSAGLGVGWAPEYRGADSYEAIPLPWLKVSKGRFFFNPISGAGFDLLANEQWTLAPVISYVSGRDNKGALSDFEQVDDSVMAGMLVGWEQGHWKLDADVAKPVTGDLEGVRVRGFLRYRAKVTDRLNYAIGPGVSWGSGDWNEALFNVSPKDAARSGLSAYQADDPYLRASLNARVSYYLTRHISVSTIARYNRLFGDAADSPIVKDVGDANQWFASILASYRF